MTCFLRSTPFVSLSLRLFLLLAMMMTSSTAISSDSIKRRVPAEWEPQAATWLQWPGPYESSYTEAFARFSTIIARYQPLHILARSDVLERNARTSIRDTGGDPAHPNIRWHRVDYDSAWMRDNGPVYVIENNQLRIQDWRFDAWGGAFGADVPYQQDNRIPVVVGRHLGLPVDTVDVVHERGNLEFNGVDTVILNWSTLGDPMRNPGYDQSTAIEDLKRQFGVEKVVMLEGVVAGDLTNGHVDGIARFINQHTAVVPDCTAESLCKPGDGKADAVYDNAASAIERAGFEVLRFPIEGYVRHGKDRFDVNYMNWLVGNGFVIVVGFGDKALDERARTRIQGYFPDRDIHMVEMLKSWAAGGGVHCHTNDQPAFPVIGVSE